MRTEPLRMEDRPVAELSEPCEALHRRDLDEGAEGFRSRRAHRDERVPVARLNAERLATAKRPVPE